jgi:hypothetical protein
MVWSAILLSELFSVLFYCHHPHHQNAMKFESVKRILLLAASAGFVVLLDFTGSILYGLFTEDMRDRLFVFDPAIGLVHRPDVEFAVPWPEAATREVVYRTNNIGLREDRPTREAADADRVIVFGDSHTDGVVNNKDSFPHVAEAIVNRDPDFSVEVLNAGIGLSCLRQHGILLNRLLRFRPRVVVFTIFVGNDYADILHEPAEPSWYDRWSRYSVILRGLRRLDFSPRMRAERINRYAMWQSLAQAYYFEHHPDSMARASQLHEHLLKSIADECRVRHIVPLVLLLPTKYLVERQSAAGDFTAIEHALGFSPDRSTDETIRHDLRSILERLRIPFVDLKERFDVSVDTSRALHFFWQADHHLSEYGHAVAGAALADTLKVLLRQQDGSPHN